MKKLTLKMAGGKKGQEPRKIKIEGIAPEHKDILFQVLGALRQNGMLQQNFTWTLGQPSTAPNKDGYTPV